MKTIALFFICTSFLFSQVSGNRPYAPDYSYPQNGNETHLYLADSTFLISARVMMNVEPEEYVLVLGVSQFAESVEACNGLMDDRINDFIDDLESLEIKKKEIYVDFISQAPVYDFIEKGNRIEEYLEGFELKKNIIINLGRLDILDAIMQAASIYKIYDLIKVDYHVKNHNEYYGRLFEAAADVINTKKDMYGKLTATEIKEKSQVFAENYRVFYPGELYKSYTAFESGRAVPSYGTKVLHERKLETFYYQNKGYSGYDMVINPIVTEPVIQYTLELKVKFEIK